MPAPPPPPWPTAAVLRHDCPDGTWHYDWLMALRTPASIDDRCALAWRIQERPDRMRPGERIALAAQPLHRACYLALEAPVQLSNDRGCVAPVGSGRIVEGGLAVDGLGEVTVLWHESNRMAYRVTNAEGRSCVECLRMETLP